MSKESLGSYSISLGLDADQDAFQKGKEAIEGVTNSISRLVGTVRNSASIIASGIGIMSKAISGVDTKDLIIANSMNVSTKSLKTWQTAAHAAHTDSKALIGAMAALDQKIWHNQKKGLPINELLTGFEALRVEAAKTDAQFEKMSANDFIGQAADERLKTIFKMAQAVADKASAANLVKDILGQAGADFVTNLNIAGKDIDVVLSDAASRVFESDKTLKKAYNYQTEFSKTVDNLKSLSSVAGAEFGGALTPYLEELNKWFSENGDTITQKISDLAKGFSKIVDALRPIVSGALKAAIPLFTSLTDAVSALLVGDWSAAGEKLEEFFGHFIDNIKKIIGITADKMQVGSGTEFFQKQQKTMEVLASEDAGWFTKALTLGGSAVQSTIFGINYLLGNNEEAAASKNYVKDFKEKYNVDNIKDLNSKQLEELITFMFSNPYAGSEIFREIGIINFENLDNSMKGKIIERLNQDENARLNASLFSGDLVHYFDTKTGKYNKNKTNDAKYTAPSSDGFYIPIDSLLKAIGHNFNFSQRTKKAQDYRASNKVNDGIIRPNGQVTQVAPDDWVFAVRNIGDLAGAFSPSVINSISGNKNSVEKTVKENIFKEDIQYIRSIQLPSSGGLQNTAKMQAQNKSIPLFNPVEFPKLNSKSEKNISKITESAVFEKDKINSEFIKNIINLKPPILKTGEDKWKPLISQIQEAAKAVLPAAVTNNNNMNVPQQININITQNIDGSNEWLSENVKQQTVEGIQNGIIQAMNSGYKRLQMLPGTV